MFNTLLQVLDDGRLTDSKGRTVNFKNTIIIMTSNLGSQLIQQTIDAAPNHEMTVAEQETLNQQLLQMLKQTIRPEFLNRIDETIVFTPLNWGEIKQIVRLQIDSIQKMLTQNNVHLDITDDAIDLLANEGYDPDFGARPVKRAIQRLLLNDLSKALLGGTINSQLPIRVTVTDGTLVFDN